jgi:hypothetical protein
MVVRVFVGSSQESVFLAEAVQTELRKVPGTFVRRWDQGTLRLGGYPLPSLIEFATTYDFAVFLIGPEDIAEIRGERMYIARDNVVFEAGLFFSQMGSQRTFLMRPTGHADLPFHLPSDLEGLTLAGYSGTVDRDDLPTEVGAACNPIKDLITDLGARGVERAVNNLGWLSTGSVFLLRHAVEDYTLSEFSHILQHFHNAHGDIGIAWSRAAEFAVKPLFLLGLVEHVSQAVKITDIGQAFLQSGGVTQKFGEEFNVELWSRVAVEPGHLVEPRVPAVKPDVRFKSPLFTIRIRGEQLEELKKGAIPFEAELSGEGGWEDIFELPAGVGSWKWEKIFEKLESPEPWIHPLAILMWQAYNRESIQYPSVGVRIKFSNQPAGGYVNQPNGGYCVYRLCLLKVTATGDNADFTFSAAAVVVPYEPANDPQETGLYHLFNLAWFFRRRLLERELEALEATLDDDHLIGSARGEKIKKIIRGIDNDFRTLMADAQVRGMEEPTSTVKCFNSPLREEVRRKVTQEWPRLFRKLRQHLDLGVPGAEKIRKTLNEMKGINRFFLKVSIEELNRRLGVESLFYVLLRHKIGEFSRWQAYYDSHAPARRKAGAREIFLLRNLNDPKEIFLLCQVDDVGKAEEFMASDDLHDTMRQAGVVGNPDIYYLEKQLRS